MDTSSAHTSSDPVCPQNHLLLLSQGVGHHHQCTSPGRVEVLWLVPVLLNGHPSLFGSVQGQAPQSLSMSMTTTS